MGTISRVAQPPPEARGFRRLWRVLKQLFLEMTGAVFAILSLAWINSAMRAWTRDAAHWLIAMTVCGAAVFGFFSVTQFIRARRVR